MRMRSVIAIVALVLPAASNAQRIPLPIPRRGPGRPADLPPQPEPIAREAAYKRWRLAIESYPMVSSFSQGGGGLQSWTSFGTGTRADYLVTRNLSTTLDLTSSFLGGPMITNTVELGTRLHPEWAEHKLYPFVDLRVGYLANYARGLSAYGDFFNNAEPGPIVRYSRGFGAVAGVGMEYAITRSWSITTSGSVMQSAMSARDFDVAPAHPNFTMTSLRYTLGVKYNPVRYIRTPGTDIR
jgi:hypothetical protein